MEPQDIIELVKKDFNFLFKDYLFAIDKFNKSQSFGDCSVTLKSDYFRMKVGTDKLNVHIEFGFLKSSKMYSTTRLLEFLTQGPNQFNWRRDFDPENKYLSLQIQDQITIQSKALEPYWEDIFDYFKNENVTEKEKEIDAFIKKQWEESELGKLTIKASKEYEEKHPKEAAETRRKVEAMVARVKAEQESKSAQRKKKKI